MASIQSAFCNNTSDLQAVVSDIDKYDRKRVLAPNWKATATSNLYQLNDTGHVAQLYMNSAEMIGIADSGTAPSVNEQFQSAEADDVLFFYLEGTTVSELNATVFEAGQDWHTLKTTVCKEQADRIRSYINRPIYKRANATYQGASERDHDFIVVRINAILACADLVRSQNPEKADEIESMALNNDGTGLLDKLKRREYVLWNETSFASEKGAIVEISINSSTTGYIEDIKLHGPPRVDYDEVRVVISTGGTFAVGTSSPVYYDVYVKNDSGLRMNKVVDAEQVNGNYQSLAYGAQIRFQAGVFVANDEWSIIFQSDELPIGTVKAGQIYR